MLSNGCNILALSKGVLSHTDIEIKKMDAIMMIGSYEFGYRTHPWMADVADATDMATIDNIIFDVVKLGKTYGYDRVSV